MRFSLVFKNNNARQVLKAGNDQKHFLCFSISKNIISEQEVRERFAIADQT